MLPEGPLMAGCAELEASIWSLAVFDSAFNGAFRDAVIGGGWVPIESDWLFKMAAQLWSQALEEGCEFGVRQQGGLEQ